MIYDFDPVDNTHFENNQPSRLARACLIIQRLP